MFTRHFSANEQQGLAPGPSSSYQAGLFLYPATGGMVSGGVGTTLYQSGSLFALSGNVLPAVRQYLGASFYSSGGTHRAFAIGGTATGAAQSTVYSATVNNDGTVNTWSASTSLPGAKQTFGVAYSGDKVYVVGGSATSNPNTGTTVVYKGTMTTSGISWVTDTALPVANAWFPCVINNGYLFSIAGIGTDAVYSSPIAGALSWTTLANFPASSTFFHSAVSYETFIYAIGGSSGNTAVRRATHNGTGGLSSWTTLTSLPAAANTCAPFVVGNSLYVVGGHDGSNSVATIYKTTLTSGTGAISGWTTLTPFPVILGRMGFFQFGSFAYTVGGTSTAGAATDTVYIATLT